jgi:hypothetical protein
MASADISSLLRILFRTYAESVVAARAAIYPALSPSKGLVACPRSSTDRKIEKYREGGVTGSRGIGETIVRRFLDAGAEVLTTAGSATDTVPEGPCSWRPTW